MLSAMSVLLYGGLLALLGTRLPMVLGYEASVVQGVLGGLWVVVSAAQRQPAPGPERYSAASWIAQGLRWGGLHAALGVVVSLGWSAARGFCEPLWDLGWMLANPCVGLPLAGGIGGAVGWLLRTRRPVAWLAALGLLLSVWGLSVAKFYFTPCVFVLDPIAGFIAGPLYDTAPDLPRALAFRLWGAVAVVGLLLVGRRAIVARAFGRILAVLGVAISLWGGVDGPFLASRIQEELSGEVSKGSCRVRYDRRIPRDDAERVARQCAVELPEIERSWDLEPSLQVDVLLFFDGEQKGRLMGASRTLIAKPWRKEVYIQRAGFPHPVLRHELAHVVAGRFGRGPFRVAGSVGALWPDPGLIEGVAVDAAPKDENLDANEWSRAMLDAGLLPPLGDLFSLGFFGRNAGASYTAAGSFVGFVRETVGRNAVREWYGGAPLEQSTGQSLAALEKAWHSKLQSIELPEAARREAEARFNRPGPLQRRCPHAVDRCTRRAGEAAREGDQVGSLDWLNQAALLDPENMGITLARSRALAALERYEAARDAVSGVAGSKDGRSARAALEALGDAHVKLKDAGAAREAYDAARAMSVDEDDRRNLDTKLWLVQRPVGPDVDVVLGWMTSTEEDREAALLELGSLSERAETNPELRSLTAYLVGRRLLSKGASSEASDWLGRASPLPLAALERERQRLRLVLACASGDSPASHRALEAYTETAPAEARVRYWTAMLPVCEL